MPFCVSESFQLAIGLIHQFIFFFSLASSLFSYVVSTQIIIFAFRVLLDFIVILFFFSILYLL